MLPYLLLLAFTSITSYAGRRFGGQTGSFISVIIVVLFLVFFAGARDVSVGTDTFNYVGWMSYVLSVKEVISFRIDIGYNFLLFLSNSIYREYITLLFITALLVIILYTYTILKCNIKKYEISFFVFVSLGTYTFFFNGARQGIAAAFCFFALPYLLEKKVIPYIFIVLVAALFHKTALIVVPLIFLIEKKPTWTYFVILLGCGVVLAEFISVVSDLASKLIDERFMNYGEEGKGGGEIQAAFLIAQAIVFMSFIRQADESTRTYSKLVNIYLLGLIPAIASVWANVNPSGFLRLTLYFSHTAILIWPLLFVSIHNNRTKVILGLGFLVVSLLYFILTTSSFSSLTPYRFNSEVFS